MYTVQFSIRKDSLELFSSQDSRDFRNFSLKEKLKEEKYEEAKETMVEVWKAPDFRYLHPHMLIIVNFLWRDRKVRLDRPESGIIL